MGFGHESGSIGSRVRAAYLPTRRSARSLLYSPTVAGAGLEQALRDLPGIGTLIKDRGYRQVWRFEFAGRAYYLKFYRRGGYRDRFRRFFRGSPAMTEFTKLQGLQKAAIPSPRAVAVMLGFRLRDDVGDAVIIEAIEPAIQLDHYCHELEKIRA